MADKLSELRMNLAAIKRVDPYAKDIIDSSAHVAFYTFNPDETEWEKTDVEGAFFVYSRNAEPFNSIFINNRLNTNSLVEPVTAGIEIQNQTPFLLYRNERSRIRGFWFYNRSECDRISELVDRIVKDSEPLTEGQKSGEIPSNLPAQAFDLMAYSNNNVDIFSMLSKAQQDFNNSLTAPNPKALSHFVETQSKNVNNELNETKKIQSIQKNVPVKAVPMQIPMNNVGTSQSVRNFFAAAKPAQPKEGPLLQRMLSQPVHIDQIEKRVKTPLKEKPSPNNATDLNVQPKQLPASYAKAAAAATNNENGLNMRVISPSQQRTNALVMGTSPLATFIASNNLAQLKASQPTDVKQIEPQFQSKEQLNLLKKPIPVSSPSAIKPNNAVQLNATPGKPALMPPTMFETTVSESSSQRNVVTIPSNKGGKADTNENNNKKNSTPKGKEIGQNPKSRKKLIHENQSQTQQKDDLPTTVQPLTETQLLQAISYLMKNDPDFIRKIHEAYLKSFAEMVSQ